ncbi:hypothetical protein [Conexibacter sp. SYSU D00693]|uniref:hypothetical protein n=1 Tax=Conexibacter sp. SYSU D00693 TaxID=2812560 RepID=UPI00196B5F96|nr:hypothetical protein [Conexibacter sp. SYSU D00693]
MACALVVGATAFVAGCGDDEDYPNEARPPSPIVVTASISAERVSISPRDFGAGPIDLVVSNQSDSTQRLTLQTAGADSGIRQQTGPINPRETATLSADLPRGEYEVAVSGDGIRPARVEVGAERASAQDQLLQP